MVAAILIIKFVIVSILIIKFVIVCISSYAFSFDTHIICEKIVCVGDRGFDSQHKIVCVGFSSVWVFQYSIFTYFISCLVLKIKAIAYFGARL